MALKDCKGYRLKKGMLLADTSEDEDKVTEIEGISPLTDHTQFVTLVDGQSFAVRNDDTYRVSV